MNLASKNQTVAADQGDSPSLRIFYSWQASVKANANRSFIEAALEKALDGIHKEFELANRPELDQDARGASTFDNIDSIIFEKIKRADVFIADVTIVNNEIPERPMPNSNVLVELGYAMGCGKQNIILIANKFYDGHELMPFDLRNKPILFYYQDPESTDKASARNTLSKNLAAALAPMLQATQEERGVPDQDDKFQYAFDLMPELFTEMMQDLKTEGCETIREFFIIPNRKASVNSSQERFRYYESEHKNLKGKIDVLENLEFVSDATVGNALIYRMSENFVQKLRKIEAPVPTKVIKLSPVEKAAELEKKLQEEQERDRILTSYEGVNLAKESVEQLFDSLQTQVEELHTNAPSLGITCARSRDQFVLRSKNVSLNILWRQQVGNRVDDAELRLVKFQGLIHCPHERKMTFYEPSEVGRETFTCTWNAQLGLGWVTKNSDAKSVDDLSEYILDIFLSHAEKHKDWHPDFP